MNLIITEDEATNIISGKEIPSVERGTFLKIIKVPAPDTDILHNIVIKTDDEVNPLVSLDNGSLLGNCLDNFRFKVINSIKINISF